MQEPPVHLLEALASHEEQRRYIINATKEEYLLPEELLNDAFHFCERAHRSEVWSKLSAPQREAVIALEAALQATDLGPYDRMNIGHLIDGDALWASARKQARETLVTFGGEPPP